MIETVFLPARKKIITIHNLKPHSYFTCRNPQCKANIINPSLPTLSIQEIFMKKIDSMYDDDKEIELSLKLKLVKEVKDAFSKGKLTELYYNLLMNKISEMEK